MKVLVDIVHPADVLFFRHPLARLMVEGAQIRFFAVVAEGEKTGLAVNDCRRR